MIQPRASSQVPMPTIRRTPASSISSTSGPYTALRRVDASWATRLPCDSLRNREISIYFLAECLHELHVREALLRDRTHRAAAASRLAGCGLPALREAARRDEEERRRGERDNGEVPSGGQKSAAEKNAMRRR